MNLSKVTFNNLTSIMFGVVSIIHLIKQNLELSVLYVIACGVFQICDLLKRDNDGTS